MDADKYLALVKFVMKRSFPNTKAFDNLYYETVKIQVEELGKSDITILLVANYVTGYLLGEGHSIEDIKDAMEIERKNWNFQTKVASDDDASEIDKGLRASDDEDE